MALINSNFPAIITATLKNYSRTMTDNIMNNELLFKYFNENGLIKERPGGTSITEALLVNKNTTVSSYGEYDQLNRALQEPLTSAEFNWKLMHGSMTTSGYEMFQNQGTAQLIDILKARARQLEISFSIYLTTTSYTDGSGNGNKDINGLAIAVENGSAWSTYGGIDSNANTFWRNQWLGSVGSFTTSDNGLRKMIQLFNLCSRGGSVPKIIITTRDIFEYFEQTLESRHRIVDTKDNDIGFPTLYFKGAKVTWCQQCPSGTLYMLNPDFMSFTVGKGRNLSIGELMKSDSQDAYYADAFMIGNLTMSNRARQGVMDGITA